MEYGYLSNAPEAELFATEEYIRVAAAATADALEAFLETDRPGSGFIEEPRTYDPGRLDIPCEEPSLGPVPALDADEGPEGGDGEQTDGADDETDGGASDAATSASRAASIRSHSSANPG